MFRKVGIRSLDILVSVISVCSADATNNKPTIIPRQ